LRREAGQIPLFVALPPGTSHSGPEPVVAPENARSLAARLSQGARPAPQLNPAGRGLNRPPGGGLIALLGVKGGVGTSTLALNVAAAMAELRRVALAEMRPDFGVLSGRLRGPARRSGLELLLPHPPARCDGAAVESVLWSPERIEKLRVLSAPILQPHPLTGAHADAILNALRAGSDCVVADLSLDIREAARAAAVLADQVVLVTERTPASVAAVRLVRGELLAWGVSRDALNLAVVNRASIGVPHPLDRLEEELEMPLLDVLPPDADGCCLCETLRQTMTGLQPESLMSDKYRSIARELAGRLPQTAKIPLRELVFQ
jgi:pilus assembly protein CpaE